MTLEGLQIGSLAAVPGLRDEPEPADLAVLRILANQAAVSLHTSEQYQAGATLHRRAQRLYDAATTHARDLEERNRQLRMAEERLQVARQREVVDHERHRIARELHDSVTQYVLSAGMAVEMARGEAEVLGHDGADIHDRLRTAKELTQEAVDQLRRAIYALHQPHRDTVSSLHELLQEVASHHRTRLSVEVEVDGGVEPLLADADHELARAVGEALFNVATHSTATKAVVRLRYRPDQLLVSVSDNGTGDPALLARRLRQQRGSCADGRHRGLVNMESRIAELGGSLAFRRATQGGVRVELRVPLPMTDPGRGVIGSLVGHHRGART